MKGADQVCVVFDSYRSTERYQQQKTVYAKAEMY